MSVDTGPNPPLVEALARRVDELSAELADARRAVQARDDFLAIAAHELRTPMNALSLQIAALERLARRGGDSGLADQIERARRTVDRYVRRATVLLDVTRLNAGRLSLQTAPVCLSDLVADVIDGFVEEARFHGVTLHVDVRQRLVGRWDAQALEEILSNLVSNAIKYGGGGPVAVSASADGAGWACLSVTDRGPGIAEAEQARIFEKFERLVDGSDTRSGFGLGLWIVGQLVDAHGGSIRVCSGPGTGTKFTVRLPLEPDHNDDRHG